MSRVRLDRFDSKIGLDRGASKVKEIIWYLCKIIFFLSAFPWPNSLKRKLLKMFGAVVGEGVVIKPRVNIHFPWKLKLGDHCWLGEECWLLNFEPLDIGDHCCVSQRAFLCGGNHNYKEEDFRYKNGPITLKKGAWVGANVFVAPGVTIGEYCVVTAGAIVVTDLPDALICKGNPCVPGGPRFRSDKGTSNS